MKGTPILLAALSCVLVGTDRAAQAQPLDALKRLSIEQLLSTSM
jgi:hypothetical protein